MIVDKPMVTHMISTLEAFEIFGVTKNKQSISLRIREVETIVEMLKELKRRMEDDRVNY